MSPHFSVLPSLERIKRGRIGMVCSAFFPLCASSYHPAVKEHPRGDRGGIRNF